MKVAKFNFKFSTLYGAIFHLAAGLSSKALQKCEKNFQVANFCMTISCDVPLYSYKTKVPETARRFAPRQICFDKF